MKKNKTMRLASGLLVAVLLTTCAISGTFAKYTTGDDATDSARVAKFGVTVTATSNSAFKEEYAQKDDALKVAVEADTYVLAPGTEGVFTKVELEGTPEVAVKVTYDAELTLANWTVDATDYCPIEIKVNETTIKKATMAELKAAVEAAIDGYSKEYEPGKDLSTVDADNLAISWRWAYEGEGNDNVKDTALGDAATAATIKLDVITTVTQID